MFRVIRITDLDGSAELGRFSVQDSTDPLLASRPSSLYYIALPAWHQQKE